MNSENIIIQNLLRKYANHQISREEYDMLLSYIRKYDSVDDLTLVMDEDWQNLPLGFPVSEARSERLFKNIISDLVHSEGNTDIKSAGKKVKIWSLISMAAAALALIIMSIWIYTRNERPSGTPRNLTLSNDIASGGNKATLTLGNGKQINLNEAESGILVDGHHVTYNDGDAIDVLADGDSDLSNRQIQTITTPRGGTYQVTLSDGTKVWLNAASSLTYAADITGHGFRSVSLSGEAYFEVSKDTTHPFIVKTRGQEVKVLGTHFNISSYPDDKTIKTTLLEGSVRVNNMILKPNEQSILENSQLSIVPVNANQVVAWKNGKFVFVSEPIESIMTKLSRWYNVEVIYKGDFSDEIFTGSISRYDNISKILEKITFTQAVHFKVEGRRVTVMP
ncbi:FecR family protein [Pedobacter sp. GR22-6]|uniref:FecR family protein n=1 Tax=Pedobacter sp. GR22-6 TaxID=3127957 RepID=UPI00307FB71A